MTTNEIEQYRVAAIQFEPVLGAKAENIERLMALAETAAQGGARLVVLPEMATTGCSWHSRDEIRPYVEPIPGPTTDSFTTVAKQYNCYIVVGLPEIAQHTGCFYNSAVLVGPAGVVGVYRKTHHFAGDMTWAKLGDCGLPVWETPLGRIGILICMDAGFFEPARLLALAGADVLCFPTNWLGEKSPGPAWSTRAWENGCYLIAADRYGAEGGIQFSGGSCVLNPDGTIQALQDTNDGIVYGEVLLAEARRKSFDTRDRSDKVAARRPELYDNLTLNGYLWQPMEYHSFFRQQALPPARRSQVAAVQFAPRLDNPAANLALIEHTLAELCGSSITSPQPNAEKIDLVVFPEYALTGCPSATNFDIALNPTQAAALHEKLVGFAEHYALYLVVGFAERSGDQVFSTAVLVGPEGVLTHYRKTHVVGDEAAWCSPGTEKPPVVDLALGRIGLMIGTDLCFPEVARSMAVSGCDLLVVLAGPGQPPSFAVEPTTIPINTPWADANPHHFHLARQRAIENNCYLAFASLPYPDGVGASAVFGPTPIDRVSERILDRHGNGVVVGTVDTTNVGTPYPALAPVRSKDLIRIRQTHLYDPLQTLVAKRVQLPD